MANIQDRVERLRDLRPRIAAALTDSHEIIKEIPHNPVLIEPMGSTASPGSLDSLDTSSSYCKKKCASKDDDEEEPEKEATSYSSPTAISDAAKNVLESCKCEKTNSAINESIKDIAVKTLAKEVKKSKPALTDPLGNMNIKSISSPEPMDGES